MTAAQAQLLSIVRLDLGAILRAYFNYETTLMLRDKLTKLIRDEAGSEIAIQNIGKGSKPANWRHK